METKTLVAVVSLIKSSMWDLMVEFYSGVKLNGTWIVCIGLIFHLEVWFTWQLQLITVCLKHAS